MIYKNKTTGAVVDTVCTVSGGGWEEVPALSSEGEKPKKGRAKKDEQLRDS